MTLDSNPRMQRPAIDPGGRFLSEEITLQSTVYAKAVPARCLSVLTGESLAGSFDYSPMGARNESGTSATFEMMKF